jgi:hypothetical protein
MTFMPRMTGTFSVYEHFHFERPPLPFALAGARNLKFLLFRFPAPRESFGPDRSTTRRAGRRGDLAFQSINERLLLPTHNVGIAMTAL